MVRDKFSVLVTGLICLGLFVGCGEKAPLKVEGVKVKKTEVTLELQVIGIVDMLGGTERPFGELAEEAEWQLVEEEEAEDSPPLSESEDDEVPEGEDETALAEEGVEQESTDDGGETEAEEVPEGPAFSLAERGFSAEEMTKVRRLMLVPAVDKVWVRAKLEPGQEALVAAGMPAVVSPGSKSEVKFPGYLDYLTGAEGQWEMIVAVVGCDKALRKGQIVNVAVSHRRLPQALVLPPQAVVPEGEGNSATVFVLEMGRARRRAGLDAYVAERDKFVVAGDFADEEVVLLEPRRLRDGRRVEVGLLEEERPRHWSERRDD